MHTAIVAANLGVSVPELMTFGRKINTTDGNASAFAFTTASIRS
jgi:hypothetical protein